MKNSANRHFSSFFAVVVLGLLCVACGGPQQSVAGGKVSGIVTLIVPQSEDEDQLLESLRKLLRAEDPKHSLQQITDRAELDVVRELSYDWIDEGKRVPCQAQLLIRSRNRLQRFDVLDAGRTVPDRSMRERLDDRGLLPKEGGGVYLVATAPGAEAGNPAPEKLRLPWNEYEDGQDYVYSAHIRGDVRAGGEVVTSLIMNNLAPKLTIRTQEEGQSGLSQREIRVEWVDYSDDNARDLPNMNMYPRESVLYTMPDLNRFLVFRLTSMDRRAYGRAYVAITDGSVPGIGSDRALVVQDDTVREFASYQDLKLVNVFFAEKTSIVPPELSLPVEYPQPARVTSSTQPTSYVALTRDAEVPERAMKTVGNTTAQFTFGKVAGNEWEVRNREIDVILPEERPENVYIITLTQTPEGASERKVIEIPVPAADDR